MKNQNTSNNSRSIERGLLILGVLAQCGGEITLLELSNRVELNQSTVYRILSTFKKFNYVEQNKSNNKYRIGPAVLALSSGYLRSVNARDAVIQILTGLRDFCGETIHYAVRSGNELIYVEKIQGLHPIGLIATTMGERAPLHCTAVGKSLLAWLPAKLKQQIVNNYDFVRKTPATIVSPEAFLQELEEVKKRGYALNREEAEEGVSAIAAPVFNQQGVIGAISVTGPSSRIYEIISTLNLVDELKKASEKVSQLMGGEKR